MCLADLFPYLTTLLGVSSEIKKLEDHMRSLKCFLADAERIMQSNKEYLDSKESNHADNLCLALEQLAINNNSKGK
jgi:hypothetical protein